MTIFKGGKKGFTLIETMLIVAIIALLAGMVIPNVRRARINANEMAAVKGLKTIHEILTMHLITYNEYPDSLPELAYDHPAAAALLTAIPVRGRGRGGGCDRDRSYNVYQGYTFDYEKTETGRGRGRGREEETVSTFTCEARPFEEGATGNNRYRIDETGLLEIKSNGQWSSM